MDESKIQSINPIVYHISALAQEWDLTNPYFIALRSLLIEETINVKKLNIRFSQDYHFASKIIIDEINKENNGIDQNIKEINGLFSSFQSKKQQKDGDRLIISLFHVLLLKFLDRGFHLNKLNDEKKIKSTLLSYHTENKELNGYFSILKLFYLKEESNLSEEKNFEALSLTISLLYDILLLKDEDMRDKKNLINYYLKQLKLEESDLPLLNSENSQGKYLKIAIMLKTLSGKGLFIPEIEKEQYLSRFTKKLFRNRYIGVLNELNQTKIPFTSWSFIRWKFPLIVFFLELCFYWLGKLVSAITLPFVEIDISNLPINQFYPYRVEIIIIFNAALFAYLAHYNHMIVEQNISDEKWM